MNMKILTFFTFLLLTPLLFSEEKQEPKIKEEIVETHHSIPLRGKELHYKATAGTLLLKDSNDKPTASIFYVSYILENGEPASKRPITFCFNGGPGSSAVWLHMGAFGPKILAVSDEGVPIFPPKAIENDTTLLDITDLVFVDPMSTGHSKAPSTEEAKAFYEVEEDIKSMAQFIRLYVTKNNRWLSPKYIIGESYGTTRSAGIASHLNDDNYLTLNGIIMLSAALNFQTFSFNNGNDLPYVIYLPSYTAAAWYHHKLPEDLQGNLETALRESEAFATKEYAQALIKGDSLDSEEENAIAQKLSRYTGLDPDYLKTMNLRVSAGKYGKKIVESGELLGRFDSRFKGLDMSKSVDYCRYDPSLEMVLGPMTAVFNAYLSSDLKWDKDQEYQILTQLRPWNYGNAAPNRFLNMSEDLREVMTKIPRTQLFVASGIYDLGIPYMASQYAIDHLELNPTIRDHVTHKKYPAGHMMYFHKPSRIKLREDLGDFIRNTK